MVLPKPCNTCAELQVISQINRDSDDGYVGVHVKFICDHAEEQPLFDRWKISFDMLEYAEEDDLADIADDDISALIGS